MTAVALLRDPHLFFAHMRRTTFGCLALFLADCQQPISDPALSQQASSATVAPADEASDAIAFAVKPMTGSDADTLKLSATWDLNNEHTRFDIVLLTPPTNPKDPFTFSKGWLIAHTPSDAKAFVSRIAAIHGVPDTFTVLPSVDSVPMTAAILGKDLSRGITKDDMVAGGFKSSPAGPWLSTKLFFGDGEIELYMNINTRDGIAEFAVKDPGNGTGLLPILTSVLEAR